MPQSECQRRYLAANRQEINARARARYAENPEPTNVRNAQYRAANIEKVRAHDRARAIVKYACRTPRHRRRGHLHASWRGGMFVTCSVCGRHVGWKKPSEIAKNRFGFTCREHHHLRRGHLVQCCVCGRSAGYRILSRIQENKNGFYCREHQKKGRTIRHRRHPDRKGKFVNCRVCNRSAGYKKPYMLRRNMNGFYCKEHRNQRAVLLASVA